MTADEFKLFKDLVYTKYGIHINKSKEHIFKAKLMKIILKNTNGQAYEYYKLVQGGNKELEIEFLNEITINKTDFFREINHFNFIGDKIDSILKKNKRIMINKEIRIWSSACSSGEEPYTLGMILKECLPADINIKILATDISREVLQKAKIGEYPATIKTQVPALYLQKYFERKDNKYKVKKIVRDMITFREFNLKVSFPFKNSFDIIFCRNVMIYFDSQFQEVLVNKFYDFTTKGGLLFIGHSESLNYLKQDYKYMQPTIYTRE